MRVFRGDERKLSIYVHLPKKRMRITEIRLARIGNIMVQSLIINRLHWMTHWRQEGSVVCDWVLISVRLFLFPLHSAHSDSDRAREESGFVVHRCMQESLCSGGACPDGAVLHYTLKRVKIVLQSQMSAASVLSKVLETWGSYRRNLSLVSKQID